jgi:hypothetical protein
LALGKEIFADKIFAERPLSSAALGKAFVECLAGKEGVCSGDSFLGGKNRGQEFF